MRFARGNYIVVWFVLLEHKPHCLYEIRRVTPVAFSVEVAEEEFILQAEFDSRGGASNFSCDEGLAASWRFVVE